ncbi:hypothetical protein AKJ09_07229 [Labilithrix luteola]|uniref:RING-type E3 ubiquitin transferase n=1 Tax=Labilithrix luteola TaxID=1391654 RepID=A0A0K1Q408_9BACT|nr:GIDE domain-containing protein [Labilithrix luteola]AKV00566.1 hypothetical protein AKJ09_07229 [Labilithrix luteola]
MQYLGFVLVFVSLLALLVGLLQHLKGKKILAAPFRRTGEIAANPSVADPKGIVSCEGAMRVQQPAIAPCSGKPCVYFEIEVVQEWEKSVVTEDGVKTEKGTDKVNSTKNGAVFFLDDGSGPMAIDPREGMDVELDKSFEQAQNVSGGDVVFGQFSARVPFLTGDKRGRGVRVVEKIVPVDGSMFVKGQLVNQAISKPKGMLGSLLASRKGRAALLGATKRNAMIGFIAGAVAFVPGLGLSIFADPPAPSAPGVSACNIADESQPDQPCTGRITSDDGYDVPFTVTQAGTFEVNAHAPAGKKIPLLAKINIKAEDGTAVASDELESATVDLKPGKYTINLRDGVKGAAAAFKGGFSFELLVKRTALAADASVATTSASVAHSSVAPAAVAAKPIAKGAASGVKPNGIAANASAAPSAAAPAAPAASSASSAKPAASASSPAKPAASASAKPPASAAKK